MSDSDEELVNVRKRKLEFYQGNGNQEVDIERRENNETFTQSGEINGTSVDNKTANYAENENNDEEEVKILFDEDLYTSDDEDRRCLEEIEEANEVFIKELYYNDKTNYKFYPKCI